MRNFIWKTQDGNGYWIPCELKEKSTFGTMPETATILQKGDNVKVPENKEPQRFVPESCKGQSGTRLGASGQSTLCGKYCRGIEWHEGQARINHRGHGTGDRNQIRATARSAAIRFSLVAELLPDQQAFTLLAN